MQRHLWRSANKLTGSKINRHNSREIADHQGKQFSVYFDGLLVPSQYCRGRFRDEYTQHLQIFA
jgi:hypothetical protein